MALGSRACRIVSSQRMTPLSLPPETRRRDDQYAIAAPLLLGLFDPCIGEPLVAGAVALVHRQKWSASMSRAVSANCFVSLHPRSGDLELLASAIRAPRNIASCRNTESWPPICRADFGSRPTASSESPANPHHARRCSACAG